MFAYLFFLFCEVHLFFFFPPHLLSVSGSVSTLAAKGRHDPCVVPRAYVFWGAVCFFVGLLGCIFGVDLYLSSCLIVFECRVSPIGCGCFFSVREPVTSFRA
jgi:hypothetical protein